MEGKIDSRAAAKLQENHIDLQISNKFHNLSPSFCKTTLSNPDLNTV